jgi:peptidylprolyl isomerase
MKYLQIIILIVVIGLIFMFANNLLNKKPMEDPIQEPKEEVTEEPVVTPIEHPVEDITELKIETLVEGTGEPAKNGDTLSVMYKGTLVTGEQFDSSYDRGAPFDLQLGQGMVIQGWDKGLIGMKVGEKRALHIPSDLAYGEGGAPGSIIGPNADLIFEVELLEIK